VHGSKLDLFKKNCFLCFFIHHSIFCKVLIIYRDDLYFFHTLHESSHNSLVAIESN
jgi:hypothetical protein